MNKHLLAMGLETFDLLVEGVIISSPEGEVIYANAAVQKFADLPSLKNIPKERWALECGIFFEDTCTLLNEEDIPMLRVSRGESFKDVRIYVKNINCPEGRYISCYGSPIINGGKLEGGVLIVHDISGIKRAEIEVAKEKAFYEQIMDFLPAVIFAKDLNGNYLYTNKTFLDISGQTELKGKSSSDIFEKKLIDLIDQHDQIVKKKKMPVEFLESGFDLEGAAKHFQTIRFPILNDNSDIVALGGISWDITEKIQKEKAFEEERMRMQASSKHAAIGVLSAEICHEINNPLSIIQTSAKILQAMLADENITKQDLFQHVQVIQKTVERISAIMSALKNISRDSRNEEFKELFIEDFVKDISALSELGVKFKGIKLIKEMDSPDILAKKIRCLRIQLSEVFINLIGNACDALENVKDAWIKLQLSEDEKFFYFKISDNGEGVSDANREKIFEAFYSTKDYGQGTGLGLSISKNIMQKHCGDIYLEEGSKSTFVVKVPKI